LFEVHLGTRSERAEQRVAHDLRFARGQSPSACSDRSPPSRRARDPDGMRVGTRSTRSSVEAQDRKRRAA
jgi:hypothetical protein